MWVLKMGSSKNKMGHTVSKVENKEVNLFQIETIVGIGCLSIGCSSKKDPEFSHSKQLFPVLNKVSFEVICRFGVIPYTNLLFET